MIDRERRTFCNALGLALAVGAPAAWAQQYPDRQVTLVVGSAPGGFTDTLGRILAQRLAPRMGHPVIVDNKPGASTTLGTAAVARAVPDGYTLLVGHFSGISVGPSLYAKLSYDPIKDLTPIVRLASTPVILTLHPSVPARTLKEFIEYVQKRPGQISYASSGVGTAQHLAAVQFQRATRTEMVHIPYKGSSQAMQDLLSGRVQLNFESPPNVLQHIKAGKLRGIAITSAKRSSLVPDLPTMDEAGLAGFEMSQWFGLMGPAGLPKPVVATLNREVNAVLSQPEVLEQIVNQGGQVLGGTAEEFESFQKADVARWATLIREAGIKPE